MDDIELEQRIADIVEGGQRTPRERIRLLTGLAVQMRDIDDIRRHEIAVAAFGRLKHEHDETKSARFMPPRSYLDMYSVEPAICVFKEKHGRQYYDISTPDRFAQTFLHVLKERVEDGWYDCGEPALTGKPDAMVAAYLDTLAGSVPVRAAMDMAVSQYRDISRMWMRDETMQTLRGHKVAPYLLAQHLQKVRSNGEPDALVAYVAQALLAAGEEYGPYVHRVLEGSEPDSLCAAVLRTIVKADQQQARDILASAAEPDGSTRRAGRVAYGLLTRRRDFEYEGFETETLQQARPDLSAYRCVDKASAQDTPAPT